MYLNWSLMSVCRFWNKLCRLSCKDLSSDDWCLNAYYFLLWLFYLEMSIMLTVHSAMRNLILDRNKEKRSDWTILYSFCNMKSKESQILVRWMYESHDGTTKIFRDLNDAISFSTIEWQCRRIREVGTIDLVNPYGLIAINKWNLQHVWVKDIDWYDTIYSSILCPVVPH